ncbi:MAG: hypothetical protein CME06_18035 [Gemmatimonadetes bacterium]|nr:hypothetical protein [Gemmatimonadota bacterium]
MNRHLAGCLLAAAVSTLSTGAIGAVRSAAMGGVGFPDSRGIATVLWNPALLDREDRPPWSVAVLALDVELGNSSLSLSDYKRYNGAVLSESDKSSILSAIDADGLETYAAGRGLYPGVQYGSAAIFATTRGAESGKLSKAAVEAVLIGFDLRDELDLAGQGEATLWTEIGVAYAHRIGDVQVGASVKRLFGHYTIKSWCVGEVTPILADSVLKSVGTDGSAYTREADGGGGWGIDLGFARQWESTTLSVSVSNLVAQIDWSGNPWLQGVTHRSSDLVGEEFPEGEETDESVAPFTTDLPATWRLGAAHRPSPTWTLVAGMVRDSVTGSELGLGSEWRGVDWLPLRFGTALHSVDGIRLSTGLGLIVGGFNLDLSVGQGNGVFGGAKGVGVGVGVSFAP